MSKIFKYYGNGKFLLVEAEDAGTADEEQIAMSNLLSKSGITAKQYEEIMNKIISWGSKNEVKFLDKLAKYVEPTATQTSDRKSSDKEEADEEGTKVDATASSDEKQPSTDTTGADIDPSAEKSPAGESPQVSAGDEKAVTKQEPTQQSAATQSQPQQPNKTKRDKTTSPLTPQQLDFYTKNVERDAQLNSKHSAYSLRQKKSGNPKFISKQQMFLNYLQLNKIQDNPASGYNKAGYLKYISDLINNREPSPQSSQPQQVTPKATPATTVPAASTQQSGAQQVGQTADNTKSRFAIDQNWWTNLEKDADYINWYGNLPGDTEEQKNQFKNKFIQYANNTIKSDLSNPKQKLFKILDASQTSDEGDVAAYDYDKAIKLLDDALKKTQPQTNQSSNNSTTQPVTQTQQQATQPEGNNTSTKGEQKTAAGPLLTEYRKLKPALEDLNSSVRWEGGIKTINEFEKLFDEVDKNGKSAYVTGLGDSFPANNPEQATDLLFRILMTPLLKRVNLTKQNANSLIDKYNEIRLLCTEIINLPGIKKYYFPEFGEQPDISKVEIVGRFGEHGSEIIHIRGWSQKNNKTEVVVGSMSNLKESLIRKQPQKLKITIKSGR